MTALEQKLLEQLEQEQQLNNTILMNLKNLFQEQNKVITQNTEQMKKLSKKIEDQQGTIHQQQQQIEILTQSLKNLSEDWTQLIKNLQNLLNE